MTIDGSADNAAAIKNDNAEHDTACPIRQITSLHDLWHRSIAPSNASRVPWLGRCASGTLKTSK